MTDISDFYLNGKLLIATPALDDPRFHHAVILLCSHDENGAMGLVINNELQGVAFEEFLDQLQIKQNSEGKTYEKIDVMGGGPVEGQRGFILHSSDFSQADTLQIDPDVSVTGTIDALKEIARGHGPEHLIFILGYAGWGPGQLAAELQSNAWLVAEPDADLVFKAPHNEKWRRALQKIGVDPALFSIETGQA